VVPVLLESVGVAVLIGKLCKADGEVIRPRQPV
jgi:hypothetical protein